MKKELGIIGLGKMGSSIGLHAKDLGYKVVGKDMSEKPDLSEAGIEVVTDYKEFVELLTPPRIIFLSLPAGKVIDIVLEEVSQLLEKGDVILDGGNSFFLDSIRRHKEISEKRLHFLDCGTSGGVSGAREGACFMVGGEKEGIALAEPILIELAVQDGYLHTGDPGSGHFVKLVHNGIEFGMLQAIGEGIQLLKQGPFELKLGEILHNWNNGSVIRSWLVELMEEGIKDKKNLKDIPSYIEDTGEVNWLVQWAINQEIPIPTISTSIMELFKSRKKDFDMYRAIAMMRHGFGGHPYGEDDYIKKERKTSRLSPL